MAECATRRRTPPAVGERTSYRSQRWRSAAVKRSACSDRARARRAVDFPLAATTVSCPPDGCWAIIAVSRPPSRAPKGSRGVARAARVARSRRRSRVTPRATSVPPSHARPIGCSTRRFFPSMGAPPTVPVTILQPPSRATHLAARRTRPDLTRPRALSVILAERPSGLGRRTTRTASAPMSSSFSSSSRSGSACSQSPSSASPTATPRCSFTAPTTRVTSAPRNIPRATSPTRTRSSTRFPPPSAPSTVSRTSSLSASRRARPTSPATAPPLA